VYLFCFQVGAGRFPEALKKFFVTKRNYILLFLIFVIAYFFRAYYIPEKKVIFGYEQARDAFVVQDLLHGDFKILGPQATTEGLHHGVFYYYLIAPAYFFGKGDPTIVAYWLALLNSLTVFVVFYLTYLLTKKPTPALLASLFFAFSFESTQYATWLSNPTFAVFSVPLIYLGLWIWVNSTFQNKKFDKWLGPIITSIGLGLSIQSEIFLIYHIVPVILWILLLRKNLTAKQVLIFFIVLAVTLLSMVIAEAKFGFQLVKGVVNLAANKDKIIETKYLGDFIIYYLNQLGNIFSDNLFPVNSGYGGFMGLFILIYSFASWVTKRTIKILSWEPFLITYILSHIIVVSLGGLNARYLTVGLGTGVIILAAIFVYNFIEKRKYTIYILVMVILISNASTIFSKGKEGQVILANQKDLLLSNELAAVEYTYVEANKQPFSINTITNPLWMNATWSYIYNWYGNKNYGYLPYWRGRDQVGQLGNNLNVPPEELDLHFLIVEPPQGIPGVYLESENGFENNRSQVIKDIQFGDIRVDKRKLK